MKLVALLVLAFACLCCASGKHSTSHLFSKLSFKPPFNMEDGAQPIQRWNTSGTSKQTADYIRLTSDTKGERGYMYNLTPYSDNSIELTLEFRVHSQTSPGADGMVLWLTKEAVKATGPSFGGPSVWDGLAIIMDTYDNDGKDPHPYIQIHSNNGSATYQFAHDGVSTLLGGCHAPYRNAERSFLHLFVENGLISVLVDAKGDGVWTECLSATKVSLPEPFFLSLTAATGGYSDNHDVISMAVSSMESRSLEMYRPPAHAEAARQTVQRKAACTMSNECVNLAPFDEMISSLDSFTQTIGKEFDSVRQTITTSIQQSEGLLSKAQEQLNGLSRGELQQLHSSFDDQMFRIASLRDRLAEENKPSSVIDNMRRATDSLRNLQHTLNSLRVEQKSLTQIVDLQLTFVSQPAPSNIWVYLILVLSLVHLAFTAVSLLKPQRRVGLFQY